MRFSLGAGYIDEQFLGRRITSPAGRDLGRTTEYAFGELLVPLIGEQQSVPLARRLELSLAARYTSHDDTSSPGLNREFGSDTVPKIGVLWSPVQGLNVRGTYGESFRAPSLTELDPTNLRHSFRRALFRVAGQISPLLVVAGPSPDLGPEEATSYTLGFDYRPAERPGFALSVTYFNIDYTDRIQFGTDFASRALTSPLLYPDFVYQPTAAAIEQILATTPGTSNDSGIDFSNPQTAAPALLAQFPNMWVSDQRVRNLALYELDGFDVSLSDRFDTQWGSASIGVDLTRILAFHQQLSPNTPVVSAMDIALRPVSLRGRAFVGLNRGGFVATLSANYVDDYENPFAVGGPQRIQSWTTLDWAMSYDFGESGSWHDGLGLRLSVQNLLDRDPPFVAQSAASEALIRPIGFDPSNANPLGRFLAVGLTKRW